MRVVRRDGGRERLKKKRIVQCSSTLSIMRFCWLISSLVLTQPAFVFGDENLFIDGLYDPLVEWTIASAPEYDPGPAPGYDSGPLLWSPDDGQLIQDSDFGLASLPINDVSSIDFWASCPPVGIGKRDGQAPSCPVPLRKEEIPTLPTLSDLENAVGNPSEPEAERGPLRENSIVPLYRPDSKCPPMNPWHMCCICDDAFALEVCQDCFLCESARF